MTQQDLFTNQSPRVTIGKNLLDLLADIQARRLPISRAEQILSTHFPGLTIQSDGAELQIDGFYRGLSLSLKYRLYEEIKGNTRVPRLNFQLHVTGHHYLPEDE